MAEMDENGLWVDAALRRFIEEEALPGTGVERGAFWSGLAPAPRADAGEPAPAAPARGSAGADRRAQRRPRRAASPIRRRKRSSCARSAISPIRRRPSRSAPRTSIPRSPPSPGRSSSSRSATPATPSTPPTPAGAASTTRSTAPTRWATAPPAGGYDPERGARVIGWGRAFLDEIAPLDGGSHAEVDRLSDRGRRLVTDRGGLADPAQLAGWRRAAASCSATTASTSRSCIDRDHPIGRDRPGRHRRHPCSKARSPRSWTARTASPRSTPRRRSRVYRNWLGPDEGRR